MRWERWDQARVVTQWVVICAATALSWALVPAAAAPERSHEAKHADASGPLPDQAGGGEFRFTELDDMSDELRLAIWSHIHANLRELEKEGKLPPPVEANPLLAWPLALALGISDPGYHGISNFVDQNSLYPNQVRDYNCGGRSYDLASGYNHGGIDFFTWPFGWRKMDQAAVHVVAAAAGTIVHKSDGNYDRSCGFGGGDWNAVYVRHADNSIAWYGHMKNGSVTTKPVGAAVVAGETLGVVGSSGNSTAPHLHFEVYDSAGALNEPYAGACNSLNAASWWQAQRPYYDSAVNYLSTGFAAPAFPACPNPESPNERSTFAPGNSIYFTAYYRDQLSGQVSQYRVRRPDGSIHTSWMHSSPVAHYAASYWYFSFGSFASGGPLGTWSFEVTFQGQTYSRPFTLALAAAGRVPDRDGAAGSGLRVEHGGGDDVTLNWGPSCIAEDADYAVYEGFIGDWTSHDARICSTGGALTATLTPFQDSGYYLVVPSNGVREGSYGNDSSGAERLQGITSCYIRLIAACP